jgi:hypothetical protein
VRTDARLTASLLLALAAGGVLADEIPESQRILECVRDNMPSSPHVVAGKLKTRPLDAPQAAPERIAFEAALRDRDGSLSISIIVTAPSDLAGSAYLFRQNPEQGQLHYYNPELDRVRRIRGGDGAAGIFGSALQLSDFDDIERTMRSASITLHAAREADPAHHRRFTVLPAASAESPFGRIDMTVDTRRCFVIAAELTSPDGELTRRLRIPEEALERREAGFWYPQQLRIEDHTSGRRSEVVIERLRLPAQLPEARFSPEGFYRRD